MLGSIIRDVSGRIQAEAEIRRRAEQAEALVRVAGKLTARLDLETVLEAVCKETARALQVQASMVLLYDQSKDQLTQRAFFNSSGGQVVEMPPLPRAAFEMYAPASKAISILPDLKLRSEKELAELSEKLDARTAIYLRMNHDRHFIGMLVIYTCGQRREFTKDELSLLTGFASQAAAAIYNAWLFEQVRKGRESLAALSRMLLEVQEEERRSLSRELHDQIGQSLTGLKMLFESLDGFPVQATERIELGRSLVVDLIERTRRISLDLRPSMLDDLGLLPALLWHNERCREQAELEIDFKHAGLERRFPTENRDRRLPDHPGRLHQYHPPRRCEAGQDPGVVGGRCTAHPRGGPRSRFRSRAHHRRWIGERLIEHARTGIIDRWQPGDLFKTFTGNDPDRTPAV
jgi:signal transduction histidine kinase